MLHIKYFVSCLQVAQSTAVFNEKPSRCSGAQSAPECAWCLLQILNAILQRSLSCQLVTVTAATVAGKVTRGLTNPAGTAVDANPRAPSHSPLASKPAFLSHFIEYFQNSSTMLYIVLYFLILKP